MTLPVGLSMVSGVNAIAHAIEALYSKGRNPISNLIAVEGIRALALSLPGIAKSEHDGPARELALYGAWLCGMCLGSQSMSLHHNLCHVLGGSFGLPHAETHTAVLPHVVSYNAPMVKDTIEKLAAVLPDSQGDAIRGLNKLLSQLRVKRALKEFGMKEEDIERATEITLSRPYANPRRLEKSLVYELIRRAWAGELARADL
ncbi:hypothetical protein BFJ63_vAg18870 [Fusarium oxysporum f. sp. narcissi]|uniref:Fe-containing alcohol dehydrogenase-like C-terminal domain-containing protein n=1 Tax=Fusarium oxysporum f. sp. narcissi TaxID=451672 RepID=A0A4V1RXI8_FUSOX|nr:hypothetical protein BFJ63_vAg18870 [Fusarium oxysporum f. sp. narcissi]